MIYQLFMFIFVRSVAAAIVNAPQPLLGGGSCSDLIPRGQFVEQCLNICKLDDCAGRWERLCVSTINSAPNIIKSICSGTCKSSDICLKVMATQSNAPISIRPGNPEDQIKPVNSSPKARVAANGATEENGSDSARNSSRAARPTPSSVAKDPSSNRQSSADQATPSSEGSDSGQSKEAACTKAQTAAIQCCTNPSSCVDNYTAASSTPTSSIKNSCNQNHDLGNAAAQSNTQAASECTVKYTTCDNTCTSAGLSEKAASCRGLSSYASQYASLGASNYDVAAQSLNCQDAASASPSSGSGSNSSSSDSKMSTASTAAAADACTSNPNTPGCGQASVQASANADALAKLSAANTAEANYNVGDSGGANTNAGYVPAGGSAGANSPSVKAIANNTGGGIPGGSGAGNKVGGILGGNGGGGLFGGVAGSGIADIDRGLRSGGYSNPAGTEEEKPDPAGGFSGYGPGRDPASGEGGRLDLKQYLPGGRLAADTLRAAAMQWRSLGIHPYYVDLWSRISEKMQLKCKLGELLDCP